MRINSHVLAKFGMSPFTYPQRLSMTVDDLLTCEDFSSIAIDTYLASDKNTSIIVDDHRWRICMNLFCNDLRRSLVIYEHNVYVWKYCWWSSTIIEEKVAWADKSLTIIEDYSLQSQNVSMIDDDYWRKIIAETADISAIIPSMIVDDFCGTGTVFPL